MSAACERCGADSDSAVCGACEAHLSKRADKCARLEDRADAAEQAAQAAGARARAISGMIPLGQPILVGHHSERRHRRDLDRIHSNYDREHEAREKAKRLRASAANVEAATAIQSEDPAAIQLLRAKIEGLEEQRERGKAANRAFKRGGWDAAEKAMGETIPAQYRVGNEPPMPAYALTNLGAEIRRAKVRIAELEAEAARPPSDDIEGDGWRIVERPDLNRLTIDFDSKPGDDVRSMLRAEGWRWSGAQGVWMRLPNAASAHSAKRIASQLGGGAL